MSSSNNLTDFLTGVADAIRAKTGSSAPINAQDFATEIANIPSGGGGSGSILVKVVDYDGTIIKEEMHEENDTFTMPEAPTHSGLVFEEWSSPVTITNGSFTVPNRDIIIGPIYHTSSGVNELDIELTIVTGLTFSMKSSTTIYWGDGTSSAGQGSSDIVSHTYINYGKYTITFADDSVLGPIHNTSNTAIDYMITEFRAKANLTSLATYAFINCYSLKNVSFSKNTIMAAQAFDNARGLNTLIIPSGNSSSQKLALKMCFRCYNLKQVVIPYGISSTSSQVFQQSSNLKYISFPDTLISFGSEVFSGCSSLEKIVFPSKAYKFGNDIFTGCTGLKTLIFPEGGDLSSLPSNVCYNNYALGPIVKIPASCSLIAYSFINCYNVLYYDFREHTSIPTASNASFFSGINKLCKIVVPDSLYESWKSSTNWSYYADYIYKASEVTL